VAFLISVFILAVLVLAILTLPWWWPGRVRTLPPLSGGDLVAELGDDVATGMLTDEDLQTATRDLEATAEKSEPKEAGRFGPQHRWSWGLLALLLVPLVTGGLYLHFGNWRAALLGTHAATIYRADEILVQLQDRVKRHPGDFGGWINLAQMAKALGKYDLSAQAYGRAVKLTAQPDADLLSAWGGAQILADPQHLNARERAIFNAVLKVDPGNIRGLWYGGLLAMNKGQRDLAIRRWRHLLARSIPAPMAELIRTRLQAMNAATSALPIKAGGAVMTLTASPRIVVTVKLAPGLGLQFKPGETLFVLARSPRGGTPFAVRRISVRGFPVDVDLSDSDALTAGHDLSHARGVIQIEVRLSPNGNALDVAGVLVGTQRISLKPGTQNVTLVINHPAHSTP
jgi:cytochrome c-type biogenesis protein CcmH